MTEAAHIVRYKPVGMDVVRAAAVVLDRGLIRFYSAAAEEVATLPRSEVRLVQRTGDFGGVVYSEPEAPNGPLLPQAS